MGKNNEKQFTITLTERQLKLLAYACRVTDRLIIGQLDFSLQECCEAAFEKLHKTTRPLTSSSICKRSWSMLYGWRKTRKSGQTGPTTLLSTQAQSGTKGTLR